MIVGGENPSVGVGGWLLGAGHGQLSAKYGLGVDNVLEMLVVTPTGEEVTASECENSDLFWALRGGVSPPSHYYIAFEGLDDTRAARHSAS